MAGTFKRRVIFDFNQAEFDGRVTEAPTLEIFTRPDKTETEVCRFQVVCNSNPFSAKQAIYFNCFCYGIKATRTYERIKKGYTVHVIAETKSHTTKADKKLGIPAYVLNEFEVRWIYILFAPEDGIPKVEKRPGLKINYAIRDIKSIMQHVTKDEEDFANALYPPEDPE